jgi:MFS transporter, DHA2 family, multidrug resistance protein
MAIAAPVAAQAADRWGPRGPMAVGLAVEAAGLLAVARCGDSTPIALVGAALALVGLGLGIFQVPNIAQAMAAFPPRQQGAAGGFAFLSRTAGIVVGVQTAAWLFNERALILGFLPAFRFTFAAAAAVCALAALVALLPGREPGLRATRHEA